MQNYDYPNGKFGVDAKCLEDFVPEAGGTPMRSIIVSSWRSGSTFLGDLINSVPGNYYHFEPLLPYGTVQIRWPPNDTQPLRDIKNLLNCNYSGVNKFFQSNKINKFMFGYNWRVWNACNKTMEICYHPKFLGQICKLFPLQSMKLVRMRLKVAQQLLDDSSLNVRVLFLVRDPRGVLQSRKHQLSCLGISDCGSDDPQVLCADMVSDYQEAVKLTKKYPLTFKAIRYEDLSLSPFEVANDILQFYGLPFDNNVEKFLQSHTKQSDGQESSTYKNSKLIPYKWLKKLTFGEINKIQKNCEKAMQLWGYRKILKSDNPDSFNPFSNFPGFF